MEPVKIIIFQNSNENFYIHSDKNLTIYHLKEPLDEDHIVEINDEKWEVFGPDLQDIMDSEEFKSTWSTLTEFTENPERIKKLAQKHELEKKIKQTRAKLKQLESDFLCID